MSYDVLEYARKLVSRHSHSAAQGETGIITDIPIISHARHPFPPLHVDSRVMVQNLNSEYWMGYKVLDPRPLVVQRFATLALRPDFGTQGRLVYIEDQDVVYLDIGSAWVALAEEGAIDWDNITNKPSTFAPSAHHGSHEDGGSDEISLDASQIATGTLSTDRIPNLAASKITSGILDESIGGFGKEVDLTGLDDGYIFYYDADSDTVKVKAATLGGAAVESLTAHTKDHTMSETISDTLTVTQTDS